MAKKTRFGVLLKQYRQAAGLSQEALAEQASISARAISDLERGVNRAPRGATLALLADALSLSAQQRDIFHAVTFEDATSGFEAASPETSRTRCVIPLPPTRLIGRDTERIQVVRAFLERKTRLLTLIGPSGVGKTRLALEIAQDLAPYYSDGVIFVPLAAVRDAALAPNAIAPHLGIHETPALPISEQVQAFLRDRSLLLVLDNLEQVLDCAPWIARLLETCPQTAVLATSRSPLRLRGERELLLSPLPLSDAAALFIERAQAIQGEQEYSPSEVEAICEQIDRLPLAIELAARQVKLFSIPELRQQLTQRFTLLRHWARDLPPRQKTMEDAIAWSYDLLTEPQQRCFRTLGCFTGGWTSEAAEWLWLRSMEGEQTTDAPDVLEEPKETENHERAFNILEALVESSLVQAERMGGDSVRFSMLELVRQYALDRLHASGESAIYQRAHALYYARLAEKVQAMYGAGQASPDLSLAREEYNVQEAMRWAETHHEAILGLRLTSFTRLWHMAGQFGLVEEWTERMLAIDHWNRTHGLRSAPLSKRIVYLSGFARILLGHGKLDRAETVISEALQLAEEAGDPLATGQAWMTCGMIAQARGQLDEAEQAYRQGQRLSETANDDQLTLHLYVNLAEIARMRNDLIQAEILLNQAMERAESAQSGWDAAIIMTLQGFLANQQRDFHLARIRLFESLQRLRPFDSPIYIAWCLEGCAVTLLAESRYQPAVRLCAAAVQLRQKAGSPLPPSEREAFEQVTRQLQAELGQKVFTKEWELGARLSQDEVIELALASLYLNA